MIGIGESTARKVTEMGVLPGISASEKNNLINFSVSCQSVAKGITLFKLI